MLQRRENSRMGSEDAVKPGYRGNINARGNEREGCLRDKHMHLSYAHMVKKWASVTGSDIL